MTERENDHASGKIEWFFKLLKGIQFRRFNVSTWRKLAALGFGLRFGAWIRHHHKKMRSEKWIVKHPRVAAESSRIKYLSFNCFNIDPIGTGQRQWLLSDGEKWVKTAGKIKARWKDGGCRDEVVWIMRTYEGRMMRLQLTLILCSRSIESGTLYLSERWASSDAHG